MVEIPQLMTDNSILVVEDEAIIALELKMRLLQLGFAEVRVAASGPEALQQVSENPPDLILMDMMLRGDQDGIETATEIRKKHQIPVIYMTGNSHLKSDSRLEATKPYWFLVKPVPDHTLFNMIQKALEA